MTINEFKKSISEKRIFLAYFSTPECNVCKVLRPKVQELIRHYKTAGFLYVNTHESTEIAGQFTVFSVPTIIIFINGQETKRLSRIFSISELTEYLDRLSRISTVF